MSKSGSNCGAVAAVRLLMLGSIKSTTRASNRNSVKCAATLIQQQQNRNFHHQSNNNNKSLIINRALSNSNKMTGGTRIILREGSNCATDKACRVLTEDNVYENLVKMEYAVRGPLLLRATELEKELNKVRFISLFTQIMDT